MHSLYFLHATLLQPFETLIVGLIYIQATFIPMHVMACNGLFFQELYPLIKTANDHCSHTQPGYTYPPVYFGCGIYRFPAANKQCHSLVNMTVISRRNGTSI